MRRSLKSTFTLRQFSSQVFFVLFLPHFVWHLNRCHFYVFLFSTLCDFGHVTLFHLIVLVKIDSLFLKSVPLNNSQKAVVGHCKFAPARSPVSDGLSF